MKMGWLQVIFSHRITFHTKRRNLRIEKNWMEFVNELLLFTIIEYTYRFLFHFHLINYLRKRHLFSQNYISGHEEIKNWTEFVNSELSNIQIFISLSFNELSIFSRRITFQDTKRNLRIARTRREKKSVPR